MFGLVMFLVPMATSKSNKRSAIFVWKLPLDVPLDTQGKRHTGKTNMAINIVFDGMIHEVSILFMDEGSIQIMLYLIVLPPPTCSNHPPIDVHNYGFDKPEAFIRIIPGTVVVWGTMVTTTGVCFMYHIAFFGDTFNLLLQR